MKALLLVALAACHRGEPKRFGPRFFSDGTGTRVVCSKGLDRTHEWPHDELSASLEHALDAKIVLQTFAHAPTLDLSEYVSDFDWATANGLKMVTFRDIANGYRGPGWAFSVDDDEVDTWFGWRERLRQHHVHVTFFVTRYDKLTDAQRQELRELAKDGHDIEAHGVAHANALDYVKLHDLDSYVRDEVMPSANALAEFSPIAFAYPYGAHDHAIDNALLAHFKLLRTTGGDTCLK